MTSKEKIEALNYIWFYEPSCQEEQDKRDAIIRELKKDLEILDILKKCENEKHSLYCVYVLNALSRSKITQDDVIKVKEWLDGNL